MFETLEKLHGIIEARKKSSPDKSYTARLFKKGRGKISQKLGEEAVELVVEAVGKDKKGAILESADLLYHLLVLWADMGIKPEKVMVELQKRCHISGIEEKKSRKKV